jgi:hypothetical protein
LTWRHPRHWRALRRLELEARAPRKLVGRIRADVRDDRIRSVGSGKLEVVERRSSLRGNGRTGHTLTLRVAVRVRRSLAGKTLRIDALAEDRRGHRQRITDVGTLRVKATEDDG